MTTEIAQTIANHIGHRAFFMMGTKNRIADGNKLIFDVRGSKAVNKVVVELMPSDTYTVTFAKMTYPRFKMPRATVVATVENVYAEQLNSTIAYHTRLDLSL